MLNLSTHPVLLVIAIAVIAVLLSEIPLGFRVPILVLQVVLGIIVGSHVL